MVANPKMVYRLEVAWFAGKRTGRLHVASLITSLGVCGVELGGFAATDASKVPRCVRCSKRVERMRAGIERLAQRCFTPAVLKADARRIRRHEPFTLPFTEA